LTLTGNGVGLPDALAVSAIDRFGNESERVMLAPGDAKRTK
jgi:hypothetical protein